MAVGQKSQQITKGYSLASVLRTPALRVADPPLCSLSVLLSVALLNSEFHCILGGAEMGAAIQAHADASDVGIIVKSVAQ